MTDPKILFFAYVGMLTCLAAFVLFVAYVYQHFFPND